MSLASCYLCSRRFGGLVVRLVGCCSRSVPRSLRIRACTARACDRHRCTASAPLHGFATADRTHDCSNGSVSAPVGRGSSTVAIFSFRDRPPPPRLLPDPARPTPARPTTFGGGGGDPVRETTPNPSNPVDSLCDARPGQRHQPKRNSDRWILPRIPPFRPMERARSAGPR